ncbi:MAG: hypothetical protein QM401_05015 [Bacillota bacterium]|nr:hypothetical protein [Bacillota bacterium]
MPTVDSLSIPFWGYEDSESFVLKTEIKGVELDIFTAFIIEWETLQLATRQNFVSSWFMLTPELLYPTEIEDAWAISLDWADYELKIRTYLRSGVADIYPTWNGIKSLNVTFANFLDVPDYKQIDEGITFKNLITKFELGHEQRRSKGIPRRNWVLTFRKDSIYAHKILEFFHEMQGQAKPFLWNNPLDGMKYRVRFADPTLTNRVRWNVENNIQIGLVEVHDGDV